MEQRSATSDTPTITDKCIVYGGMTTSFRLELREKGNNKTYVERSVTALWTVDRWASR